MIRKVKSLVVVIAIMVMVSSSGSAKAQDDQVPECVNELDPCGPFINSTTVKPPAECCNPLSMVLKNELPCICTIFSSIETIQALSLNVTEALTLPQRCGINFDLISACQALSAPTTAPSMAPAPAPSLGASD